MADDIIMKVLEIFLLFLCVSMIAYAGDTTLHKVYLTDAETHQEITGAVFINKAMKTAAYTNSSGIAWVHIIKGDSILITAKSYFPYTWVVQDADLLMKELPIQLVQEDDSAREIVIKGEKDDPLLLWHQETAKLERDKIDMNIISRGIIVSGLIQNLADRFNKKQKRRKELKKEMIFYETQLKTATRYTDSLVMQLTGMHEDETDSFRLAYPMDPVWEGRASDLELAQWIRDSFKAWRKRSH